MATMVNVWWRLLPIFAKTCVIWGIEYCEGNYWCDKGHCCGKGKCCTYNYYELWWFWVIWLTIALLGCCCFYQRKRLRGRRRRRSSDRSRPSRRSHTEATLQTAHHVLNAQQAAQLQFYPPVFEPGKELRLPTYEEISDLPKDPPSYNLLYNTTLPQTDLRAPQETSASSDLTMPLPSPVAGAQLSGNCGSSSPIGSSGLPQEVQGINSESVSLCTTSQDSCGQDVDESLSAGLLDNAVDPSQDEFETSFPQEQQGEPPPYTSHTPCHQDTSTSGSL